MAVLYDYDGDEISVEATDIASGSVTMDKLASSVKKSLVTTPEMFGAVGDGSTDDTTAVQNAVNQAGVVYFGKTYRVTATISINYPNTHILGPGTIIGDIATNNSHVLRCGMITEGTKDHIRITDINIRQASGRISGGIMFTHELSSGQGYMDIIIEGVSIIGMGYRGITLHGGPYNSNYVRPYFIVDKCYIADCGDVGICTSRTSAKIQNCYVSGSALENITLDNGGENFIVTNNILKDHRGGVGSIGIDEADGAVISNNHIYCKAQSSWDTEYNASIGCQCNTGNVENIVVHGNVFNNGKYGIKLGGTYKASGVFTDNIFKSVGTSQFYDKNIGTCIKDNNLSVASET